MKKLINLLRGYVELEAVGAFPERLLNLCAQNRLQFWRLCWIDETSFTFRIALQDRKRLDELARRSMCELTERGRRGAAVGVPSGAGGVPGGGELAVPGPAGDRGVGQ